MSSPVKQGQYCVFVVTKVPGTNYSLNATASISVVDCVSYRLVMFEPERKAKSASLTFQSHHTKYYSLNVPVLPRFICWNLIPNVVA